MACSNSMVFLTLLVAVSTLMAAPSVVEAQLLNNIIEISGTVNGTVPCSLNTTLTAGNPFRNTAVELRCGINNSLLASTTTDTNGNFSITIDPPKIGGFVTAFVAAIRTARNCWAVVPTPLFTCNSTRPSNGTLVSSLTRGRTQRAGRTITFPIFALAFMYNK